MRWAWWARGARATNRPASLTGEDDIDRGELRPTSRLVVGGAGRVPRGGGRRRPPAEGGRGGLPRVVASNNLLVVLALPPGLCVCEVAGVGEGAWRLGRRPPVAWWQPRVSASPHQLWDLPHSWGTSCYTSPGLAVNQQQDAADRRAARRRHQPTSSLDQTKHAMVDTHQPSPTTVGRSARANLLLVQVDTGHDTASC